LKIARRKMLEAAGFSRIWNGCQAACSHMALLPSTSQ
jgi:hypothetical protein